MRITRKIEVDYGHTLPNHYSFCNQLHGHRATVIVTVNGQVITKKGDSSEGMVLDFKILKQLMMEKIHDKLDHGFAVWKEDKEDLSFVTKRNSRYLITDGPPTAEYLAKWAYLQLKECLPENIKLKKLEWYETPNSSAMCEDEK